MWYAMVLQTNKQTSLNSTDQITLIIQTNYLQSQHTVRCHATKETKACATMWIYSLYNITYGCV